MERTKKFCRESLVTMTEMVMPNDTNPLQNLMGGNLMSWIDIASAISAQRHSNSLVVTASVDNISFSNPIPLGNVITLKSFVTRAFKTSMEVFIEVISENVPEGQLVKTNKAFFTFVAVDKQNKPVPVPEVVPETDFEKELYEGALRRRQLRLVLARRMDPNDADELKAVFKI